MLYPVIKCNDFFSLLKTEGGMKRGTKGSRIVHKRFFAVFYCLLLYLLIPIKVDAFKLPDTGQTKCYNTAGGEIPCAGSGQDGEYNISPLSYTDNGDGTVTDSIPALCGSSRLTT